MKTKKSPLVLTAIALVFALAFTACPIGPEPVPPEPVHVHQWGAWSETTAATCETAGEETRVCALDSSHRETRTGAAALGHDWNDTLIPATETADGIKAIICRRDASHTKETQFSGEYATGTLGLAFTLINNNTEYRVRKGTVTTGAVHIPAYHRTDVDNQYLPVTEIGGDFGGSNGAFYQTSIITVTFAENSQLKTIGAWAFGYCTGLTSITIPAGVTSIGSQAFATCSSLTSITIPAGVTSIGMGAFGSCTGLTGITVAANNPNYSSESGILYNKAKTTLMQAPGAISGNITIPASVTSIDIMAFYECTSLTGITISTGVTSLGGGAFSGCTGLTSVTIPAGVTTMGWNVFDGWTASQTINVPFANEGAKPSGWSSSWKGDNCNAVIKYWNGSSYQ